MECAGDWSVPGSSDLWVSLHPKDNAALLEHMPVDRRETLVKCLVAELDAKTYEYEVVN